MTAPDVTSAPLAAPALIGLRNSAALAADALPAEALEARHPEFLARMAGWLRDERRLAGGDAVLPELTRWTGEEDASYRGRLREAGYLNFAKLHASLLAGHLERARPMPGKGFSLGPMGDIRGRDSLRGQRTEGELFWYGADGVGNAANQFPKVAAGIQQRACATGHRWTMVEMPSADRVRRRTRGRSLLSRARDAVVGAIGGGRASRADVEAGLRPYLVEFSPLRVPYWETEAGRLEWAVVRVPVERTGVAGQAWREQDGRPGYYLLVAEGCTALGDAFAEGGWFLFDADKRLVGRDADAPMAGDWSRTGGEIPMFPLVAAQADAELDLPRGVAGGSAGLDLGSMPAPDLERMLVPSSLDQVQRVLPLSRSLTMELGQIGVALMNRISERNWNFREACKSVNYVLGVDPTNSEGFNLTVDMAGTGSLLVPVTAWRDDAGAWHAPTIWNSSAGLTDAAAAKSIIESTLNEVREIMVRQLAADGQQSGQSKQVEFATGGSNLLADMLLSRATWEGNVVYWVARRAGYSHEQAFNAYSDWPREIALTPVVEDIDAMLTTLLRAGAESGTLKVQLIGKAAEERGLKNPETWPAIETELAASLGAPPLPGDLPGAPNALPVADGTTPGVEPMAGLAQSRRDLSSIRALAGAEGNLANPDATQIGLSAAANPPGQPVAGGAATTTLPGIGERTPTAATSDASTALTGTGVAGPAALATPAPAAPDFTPITDDVAALTGKVDALAAQISALIAQQSRPEPEPPAGDRTLRLILEHKGERPAPVINIAAPTPAATA